MNCLDSARLKEGFRTITNVGSVDETRSLGKKVGSTLKPGAVVALFGDLGAGKTTFVQGLLKGLNIEEIATSPSFVIINEYKIPKTNNSLFHMDLYRLNDDSEIEDIGISDIFNSDSIAVIEWAEKIKDRLPDGCVKIYFDVISETERRITLEGIDI